MLARDALGTMWDAGGGGERGIGVAYCRPGRKGRVLSSQAPIAMDTGTAITRYRAGTCLVRVQTSQETHMRRGLWGTKNSNRRRWSYTERMWNCGDRGLVLTGPARVYCANGVFIWTSLICLLMLSTVSYAVSSSTSSRVHGHRLTERDVVDIVDFIEHTRKCHAVRALTVSVVQGDRVVLARGFGDVGADDDVGDDTSSQRAKVTEKTPFCIGSLSKAFTATLIAMQLSERKYNIDWDTPIHCYPNSDITLSDDIRSSQTSMRDLLGHKLGVPGYFMPLLVGYPESTTRRELIQRVRFMAPTLPFRGGFIYNNYMFAIAGYASELLSGGTDWEQLNRERIFEPLGMSNSGYIDQTPEPEGLARPYVHINGSVHPVDTEVARTVSPLGPAGSIYSTAEDMARWTQLHLAVLSRPGVWHHTQGRPLPFPGNLSLSSDALRWLAETYKAQMAEPDINYQLTRPVFPVDDIQLSYAMGWVRGIYRGYYKLYHTGGISTYISLLQLLPDIQAGVFLSTSGPGGRAGGDTNRIIAAYISDKLLGEAPWLDRNTACTFPSPWVPSPSPGSGSNRRRRRRRRREREHRLRRQEDVNEQNFLTKYTLEQAMLQGWANIGEYGELASELGTAFNGHRQGQGQGQREATNKGVLQDSKESERKDRGRHETASVPGLLAPSIGSYGDYPDETFIGSYRHLGFGTIHVYLNSSIGDRGGNASGDGMAGSGKGSELYLGYGRLGRARLLPTAAAGLYGASWLDQLWYLSNGDDSGSGYTVQFVDVVGGKTQRLLTRVDPSTVSGFRRGLKMGADQIPPHAKRDPTLFVCPGADPVTSTGSIQNSSFWSFNMFAITLLETLMVLYF